jgi:hypothetical protein
MLDNVTAGPAAALPRAFLAGLDNKPSPILVLADGLDVTEDELDDEDELDEDDNDEFELDDKTELLLLLLLFTK